MPMTFKKIAEAANQMKGILTMFSIVAAALIWILTNFTPVDAFNKHIDEVDLERLQKRQFELVKFIAHCSRQLEEYGSLTIIETDACGTAEEQYMYVNQTLCSRFKISCP
jgi:hypothetical protein